MGFEVGRTFSFTRSFSREDVAAFAAVALDYGVHHVEPDEHGRLMVHGLHTASLATQIGGEINYIARDMAFEFLAPVYSGDTVTCIATINSATHSGTRWRYEISFSFTNQDGQVIATGHSTGIVRDQ